MSIQIIIKSTVLFSFVFIAAATNAQSSHLLVVEDFAAKIEEIKDKLIVDVRTKAEYGQGHIAGAIFIDYYKSDFKSQLSKLDKGKPVFVYCALGVRSGGAAKILTDLGFKQVYDLQGGLKAWISEQKPIVK